MRLHATGIEREVLVDCNRVTGLIAGLVDDQWRRINAYEDGRPTGTGIHTGRPRAMARECYEGVLWVMLGGGEWRNMPKHLPGHVTVWRRLVEWREAAVWFDHVWRAVRPLASPRQRSHEPCAVVVPGSSR